MTPANWLQILVVTTKTGSCLRLGLPTITPCNEGISTGDTRYDLLICTSYTTQYIYHWKKLNAETPNQSLWLPLCRCAEIRHDMAEAMLGPTSKYQKPIGKRGPVFLKTVFECVLQRHGGATSWSCSKARWKVSRCKQITVGWTLSKNSWRMPKPKWRLVSNRIFSFPQPKNCRRIYSRLFLCWTKGGWAYARHQSRRKNCNLCSRSCVENSFVS